MDLRRLIKANARRALFGNWSRAIAVVLLCSAVSLLFMMLEELLYTVLNLPAFVDSAATPGLVLDDWPNASPQALAVISAVGVLSIFALAPLNLGRVRWFYRLGDGHADEVSSVFEYFSGLRSLLRALWLHCSVVIRSLFWVMLFELPAAALGIFSLASLEAARERSEELIASGGVLLSVVLALMLGIFAAVWCMRYYLALYALADGAPSACAAIRRSVSATKGRRGELLTLELSMIGWQLLGLLVVTQLYVQPYLAAVRGIYARYLLQRQQRTAAAQAGPRQESGAV